MWERERERERERDSKKSVLSALCVKDLWQIGTEGVCVCVWYIYIYIYIYIHVCVCIYIYIYIYRWERENQTETEWVKEIYGISSVGSRALTGWKGWCACLCVHVRDIYIYIYRERERGRERDRERCRQTDIQRQKEWKKSMLSAQIDDDEIKSLRSLVGLTFFVYWHTNIHGLLNAKAIPIEV